MQPMLSPMLLDELADFATERTPSAIRRGRSAIPRTSLMRPRGSTSMTFVLRANGHGIARETPQGAWCLVGAAVAMAVAAEHRVWGARLSSRGRSSYFGTPINHARQGVVSHAELPMIECVRIGAPAGIPARNGFLGFGSVQDRVEEGPGVAP